MDGVHFEVYKSHADERTTTMGNFDFDSMLGHDIPCTCGRTHSTDVQKIYLGSDAIDVLVATVQEMGFSHPFVVSDLNTWKAAGEAVDAALRGAGIACAHIVLPYDEPIPDEHVIGEIFCAMPQETDLIVCAGSGTLNDTCKFISYRAKIDYIVFATAPSMDGWVSIGAPLIINHMKVTIDTHGPLAVFSDPAVLAASPAKMINAGVGDVLGKYTALIDWRFSRIVNGEYVCDATVDNVRKALDLVSSNAEAIASSEPEARASRWRGSATRARRPAASTTCRTSWRCACRSTARRPSCTAPRWASTSSTASRCTACSPRSRSTGRQRATARSTRMLGLRSRAASTRSPLPRSRPSRTAPTSTTSRPATPASTCSNASGRAWCR